MSKATAKRLPGNKHGAAISTAIIAGWAKPEPSKEAVETQPLGRPACWKLYIQFAQIPSLDNRGSHRTSMTTI